MSEWEKVLACYAGFIFEESCALTNSGGVTGSSNANGA
jgi:hypothetical protein